MKFWAKNLERWLWGLTLIAFLGICGCGRQKQGMVKAPTLTVKITHPVSKKISEFDEFTGRTEAIGLVEVRARVAGYLDKVAFVEGQEVKKGEVLFEIDPRPFQAQVDQAEAKLKSNEAKHREFVAEYSRNKILHDRRALSIEELQQSEAKRDVVAAEIIGDQAQVRQAKLDLEFSKVISPVEGRIGRASVREGNLISTQAGGSPILTSIVPQSPIYAYFDVDERTLIERLKLIREQKISPDRIKDAKMKVLMGLSDGQGFPFEGSIDFVDNKVDSGTGTIRVRAMFNNDQRLLTPGLFARIRIPESEAHEATLVPDIAILTDQGLKYVWVVDNSGKVNRRDVRLGRIIDNLRIVQEGLSPNDLIIVQGIQKVREGAQVQTELVSINQEDGGIETVAPGTDKQSRETSPDSEKTATKVSQSEPESTQPAASAN